MSFKSFLTKHSGELSKVATVLGTILSALPVERQTRENAEEAINSLHASADSIAKAAKSVADVKVSKADVEKAVAAAALPLIEQLVVQHVTAALAKGSDKPAAETDKK